MTHNLVKSVLLLSDFLTYSNRDFFDIILAPIYFQKILKQKNFYHFYKESGYV